MISKINSILDLPFFADENFSGRNSHKIKKDGSIRTKTFNEPARAVKELAAGFTAYGIKPGDHIVFYETLMKEGKAGYEKDPDFMERSRQRIKSGDLLTIVYTSGTTGNPKGVMLIHRNFVQNVIANTLGLEIDPEKGEIVIVGRAKDTIVLMGQDRKQLTALIAVNEDELMNLAGELKVADHEINTEGENSIEHDKIYSVLMREVSSLISREYGFKSFERISKILAVRNNFSIGKELTQTMKVKRKYILDKYKNLIDKLHRDTRN